MDRASGSSVFARDLDAQLDMIELELTDDIQNWVAVHMATVWRLEGSLEVNLSLTRELLVKRQIWYKVSNNMMVAASRIYRHISLPD